MTLYHGATVRVEHPLCDFGRPDLDFGRGFYLTYLKEQAEEWAARQADSRKEPGVLNVYEFDRESAIQEYRYLLFPVWHRCAELTLITSLWKTTMFPYCQHCPASRPFILTQACLQPRKSRKYAFAIRTYTGKTSALT